MIDIGFQPYGIVVEYGNNYIETIKIEDFSNLKFIHFSKNNVNPFDVILHPYLNYKNGYWCTFYLSMPKEYYGASWMRLNQSFRITFIGKNFT